MTWTKEDAAEAAKLGWGLYEVWEGKLEWIIQRDTASNIFLTDEAARLYVKDRANHNDALCTKAMRLMFHSRMPNFDDVVKKSRRRG